MAVNLSRNTKVYFTTKVDPNTGEITDANSGFTPSNTFEIRVQDGYSFTQGTQQQTITLSEGGNTPVRGQRAFNSQLDPVDFSFSTYICPVLSSNVVTPQERVLWNALFGVGDLDSAGTSLPVTTSATRAATTGAGAATATVVFTGDKRSLIPAGTVINFNGSTAHASWNQPAVVIGTPTFSTDTTATVEFFKAPAAAANGSAGTGQKAYLGQWAPSGTQAGQFSYTSTLASNKNQLQKFGMIFVVDSVVYLVDNCAMDSVSLDFGLDTIATAAWTGKGTALKPAAAITRAHLINVANATQYPTTVNYITNKLSTMTLQSNIGGSDNTGVASTAYAVAITGGNITISNNINYLVPANLGVVNTSIGYFTGQRSVTGNVTAYLRTGETNATGDLLAKQLADSSTTTEPKYRVQLEMGGSSNAIKVEFEMPGAVLQIPTVDVQDVVSTTINFNAQGFSSDTVGNTTPEFDVTKANDLLVRYFSA